MTGMHKNVDKKNNPTETCITSMVNLIFTTSKKNIYCYSFCLHNVCIFQIIDYKTRMKEKYLTELSRKIFNVSCFSDTFPTSSFRCFNHYRKSDFLSNLRRKIPNKTLKTISSINIGIDFNDTILEV